MKSVRLATLAFCVLLLGLDLAVLRYFPQNDRAFLDLFALPMLNILALAFYRWRGARRLGSASPFLVGFQAIGWVAVILYLAASRIWFEATARATASATEFIHGLTLNNLSFDAMKRIDPTFTVAWKISKAAQGVAAAACLTVLMLVPAVIAGWIAHRRLTLTKPPEPPSVPEP